jgi:tetratricopeptide (TPR) repeat protein
MNEDDASEPARREVMPGRWARYPVNVDRWAVVVGISRYRHEAWNLKFARRDAEAMHGMLRSPTGGAIDDAHVVRLLDEEATLGNLNKALRTFLKKPRPEDLVIVYMACHGSTDPDRPENVYIITHDTDPDDISGTALPMREIHFALRENMRAERAIILADTCHSGSLGGRIVRGPDDRRAVAAYLRQASEAREGIALITAARAGQSSQEDEKWGGGHGVFTHFLLEGMRGAADGAGSQPRDGVVTIGELYEYVRANVRRETNEQDPWLGPNSFDDRLPMAITGGATAHEHYRVGVAIDHLARLLEDPRRFPAAAVQLREAVRLASAIGEKLPQASMAAGLAWLDAGRVDDAVAALRTAIAADTEGALPEARYHLAVALADRAPEEAALALDAFAAQFPDHELSAWSSAIAIRVRGRASGRRLALLIGVGEHVSGRWTLRGPANDVEILGRQLADRGFVCTALVGLEATHDRILEALGRIAETSTHDDDVVVYFSGHSTSHTDREGFLLASDSDPPARMIAATDIHQHLRRIRSASTWLILDTSGCAAFERLARQEPSYVLWMASRPGGEAWEATDTVPRGAFSAALSDQLTAQEVATTTARDNVEQQVRARFPKQKPLMSAAFPSRLFGGQSAVWFDNLARRGAYRGLGLGEIKAAVQGATSLRAPHSRVFSSLGRALVEKQAYTEGANLIATIDTHRRSREAVLAHAIAHAYNRRFEDVRAMLDEFLATSAEPDTSEMFRARELTKESATTSRRAVVVGIDEYAALPPLRGAANDAREFRRVLVERCGFQPGEVRLLVDADATRAAILHEVSELANLPADATTLCFMAGYGSRQRAVTGETLTFVSADSRTDGKDDITFDELRALLQRDRAQPTMIMDAGWTSSPLDVSVPARRFAAETTAVSATTRDISPPPIPEPGGRLFVTTSSIRALRGTAADELEDTGGTSAGAEAHGHLTRVLISLLLDVEPATLTARALAANDVYCSPHVSSGTLLFQMQPTALLTALRAARMEPVQAALLQFRTWAARPGGAEQGAYLHVGLAQLMLGANAAAVDAFRKHRELNQEHRSDAADVAHYLGRAHLAQGDFAAAVAELETATRLDSEYLPSHYYLGEAIRQLVERQSLVQAEHAFETYLRGGAPHGGIEEVRAQIEAWRAQRLTRA